MRFIFIVVINLIVLLSCIWHPAYAETPKAYFAWSKLVQKYRADDSVEHIILVQCLKDSTAKVLMLEKDKSQNNAWTIILDCDAYIGRNGYTLNNKKEGDGKIPCGDFGVLGAFGIKKKPRTALNYLELKGDEYWCDTEGIYYNRLVCKSDVEDITGEHLIDYSPQYNYGMFLDYNNDQIQGAGSAIFFHCKGYLNYTGGCIAVEEADMKFILKHFKANDRVIVYPLAE